LRYLAYLKDLETWELCLADKALRLELWTSNVGS
jgi:hypothetical protein